MSTRSDAAVLDVETDTTELSTKLKQLRRLKNDGPTFSRHLQSALQEGKRKPGVKKADALPIFIGISIPTSSD